MNRLPDRPFVLVLALALLCLPVSQGRAQSAAEREILASVDSLFSAMARRDAAAARAIVVPGAVFYSAIDSGGPANPRTQVDSAFVRSLTTGTGALLERYWSPTVSISGPLAQVWAPYDFHRDGVFSHCGVDVFSLLRTPAGWRIAAITYTVKRTGCAPSPLGSPR